MLDEEIGGVELSVPEPAAASSKKGGSVSGGRDMMEETRGDAGGLRYTAEANRASGDAAAAFDGRRGSDLEAGNSIAVQHDVTVTSQGRRAPTVEVL